VELNGVIDDGAGQTWVRTKTFTWDVPVCSRCLRHVKAEKSYSRNCVTGFQALLAALFFLALVCFTVPFGILEANNHLGMTIIFLLGAALPVAYIVYIITSVINLKKLKSHQCKCRKGFENPVWCHREKGYNEINFMDDNYARLFSVMNDIVKIEKLF
jgi:hypothetical protein